MKKKPRILQWALFLLLIFATVGCEKDFYENSFYQQQMQGEIKLDKISFEKFNKKFQQLKNKPKIDNLLKPSKEFQAQARTTTSSGVVIYTDDIRQITQGDYTSYTMLMELPNQTDDKFFNLTIEEKNNEASVLITRYVPTESWKANPTEKFEGQAVVFRVPGEDVYGPNTFVDYNSLPIDDIFNTAGPGETGGGGGGGMVSGELSNFYPSSCTGTIMSVTILEPYPCCCAGHWFASQCGNGCMSCQPSFAGFNYVTKYLCIPNTTGGTNPLDPSTGSPVGTPPNNGVNPTNPTTGTPTTITTIVNPLPQPEDNPCIKLKDLLDKANIEQSVNYLGQTLTEDNKKEFGAIFTRTEDKNYATYGMAPGAVDGEININTNYPNMIAAIHSHPMSVYPLFSFGDILVLNSMNNNMEPHNEGLATFLVVSKNDVNDANPNLYAIVFNTNGPLNIFDQINSQVFEGCTLSEVHDEEINKLEELFFTDPNSERAFLRYIQNTNISLYKANSSLSNWSELKLSNLSTNSNISSTDCD